MSETQDLGNQAPPWQQLEMGGGGARQENLRDLVTMSEIDEGHGRVRAVEGHAAL